MKRVTSKLAWIFATFAATVASAQSIPSTRPFRLDTEGDRFQSVYAPPEVAGEEQGSNQGGVNTEVHANFLSDYVWRGIDRSEGGGSEDSPNFQFEGKLTWDLGKFPHPFIGVFSNVYNSDPVSRFQEIRPYFGLELTARPIVFTVGHNYYIYPERDALNTAEIFAKIQLDDSYFLRTEQPLFNPYFFAAYDYDTNHGWYFELGISHDFAIEDTPLTITPRAAIAYVDNNRQFRMQGASPDDPSFAIGTGRKDSGFQHYEVGVDATYGLNQLFNIGSRYGKLDLKFFLMYTDQIDNQLRADTEWWFGTGVWFSY